MIQKERPENGTLLFDARVSLHILAENRIIEAETFRKIKWGDTL